jgi:hypothetical protein
MTQLASAWSADAPAAPRSEDAALKADAQPLQS